MAQQMTPRELAEYLTEKGVKTVRYGKTGDGCSPFPFMYCKLEFTNLTMFNGLAGWEIHAKNECCQMMVDHVTAASVRPVDEWQDIVTVVSDDGKNSYTHKLEIRYRYKPHTGKGKAKSAGKEATDE